MKLHAGLIRPACLYHVNNIQRLEAILCEDYDFAEDSNYDFAEIEDEPPEPFCDFCGTTLSDLRATGKTLVQGPRVYICKSCNEDIAIEFIAKFTTLPRSGG